MFWEKQKRLPQAFFERPVTEVAQNLLGQYFCRQTEHGLIVAKIIETEAYHQEKDPACHAYRGKTKRNAVMFTEAGNLYVYFTYGMHYCMNIVCEKPGIAAAVLLRAMEPISGIEIIRKLRDPTVKPRDYMRGPARLCQALAITLEHNGISLVEKNSPVYVIRGEKISKDKIAKTPRIGISQGKELLWRYYIKDHPLVSRPK